MPIYKVDIEKVLAGEYWTNVYHIDSVTFLQAQDDALELVACERSVHTTAVAFNLLRVSDLDPNTETFINIPLTGTGSKTFSSNQLPLFNVARVDWATLGGRAARKYLRGVLVDADIVFDTLTAAAIANINTNYTNCITNLGYVTKPDGVLLQLGAVKTKVGMRQLRRGTTRRTTPIIP